MEKLDQNALEHGSMMPAKRHTLEQIVKAARMKDNDIGDEPMIAPTEWGYWVGGSIYVSKEEVDQVTI